MNQRKSIKVTLTLLLLHTLSYFATPSSTLLSGSKNKNHRWNNQEEIVAPEFKLSPEQIETFKRDGVLVIRGLLKGKELKNAIRTAKKMKRLSLLERIFNTLLTTSYRNIDFQTWRKYKSMEHIAFDSNVPSIVAQLMGYVKYDNSETNNENKSCSSSEKAIRLLNDAFLVYEDGGVGCGWHVDDKTFWPCTDSPIDTLDSGINVWITLSPIKASEGGGLAVAPTSHNAKWREEARGFIAGVDEVTNRVLTCEMERLSPDYHDKFEELKLTMDMEPGDAIIHDRYIFHRSDAFKKERKIGWLKRKKLRISLRYMPSDANVDTRMGMEPAFLAKNMTTGDEIMKGEEYFPQVWPTSLRKERLKKADRPKSFLTWSFLIKIVKARMKK